MKPLTNKQLERVKETRKQAEEIASSCKELEGGKITSEEFERRVSKMGAPWFGPSFF